MSRVGFKSENRKFFKNNFKKNSSDGVLLFESFYDSKQLIYGVAKVAFSFAKAQNLYPKVFLPLNNKNGAKDFVKSICPNFINTKSYVLLFSIIKSFSLLNFFFKISNKKDIINIKIGDCDIGKHIYDALLIRFKEPSILKLDARHRKFIVLELIHFFLFNYIVIKENVKCVVLGDNVYRHGLLFELCKKYDIKCISPINLNAFTFSKFQSPIDYEKHCFAIDKKLINEFKNNEEAQVEISDYFIKRYDGKIEQHDVISAFEGKVIKDKDEFFSHYKLNPVKKLIVLMPHIFCDAPHAYPNTIYDDYYEWFIDTIKHLQLNKNINFLVKEHPSAHLYNEQGVVQGILYKYNVQNLLVDLNESTVSILNNADAVVTCGGTIGIEFACKGKPVILAAHPPYSNLGFTFENNSIIEYHNTLKNIHNIKPLNEEQKKIALTAAYISFYLTDNYSEKLEIGSEKILLGKGLSDVVLYDAIYGYNKVALEKQEVFRVIKKFLESGSKMIRNEPNQFNTK